MPERESRYDIFYVENKYYHSHSYLYFNFFNKKIVSYYYINKFSNWVERPVKIKKLNFNYTGYVKIEDIEILNYDKNYYQNIFKAKKNRDKF